MSNLWTLSVEIELPDDAPEGYLDAVVDDLAYEPHLLRLRRMVRHWVRLVTGANCHVEITVD